MDAYNNDRTQFTYELAKCLAAAFGINIHGMSTLPSQIFFQLVYFWPFYVYYIVLHPITPPIWQMFQALLVCFDHMHIWKVYGCSNHGPIPIFDTVW